jgi:hypothetical protein
MSDKQVKVKSKDGQATIECNEKIAAALIASGKYVMDDSITVELPEAQKTL